jgi:hypothetical protein
LGGHQGRAALGIELADRSPDLRVHREVIEKARKLDGTAQGPPALQRGKGAADPGEDQRVEHYVGFQSENRAAGIEPDLAAKPADRPVLVAMLGPAVEDHVLERPLQRALKTEPSLENHRGGDPPHRAEIEIAVAELGVVKDHPLGAAQRQASRQRHLVLGAAGNLGILEQPVERDLHLVEEAVRLEWAGHPAVERQGVEVRPHHLEVEVVEVEIEVAEA